MADAEKTISLGEDFGEAVITANGAIVAVHADGSIDAYTGANVRVHRPANDASLRAKNKPQPGDEMPDGSIYAGVSPDRGKPMYTTQGDAPGTYTSEQAAAYARHLAAHGHHDFHVPSMGELNVLYQNRDKGKLKETFKQTGPDRWYVSSKTNYYGGWVLGFRGGGDFPVGWDGRYPLRCVR